MKAESTSIIHDNNDAKKVFRKLGTCSQTFFHILNREFGHVKKIEERAADPLSGGIMRQGYQCGMLWGASLAVGAEAYRRCENTNDALAVAIKATQSVMTSFEKSENTINCREITNTDFNSKWSFIKYMFSGRFLYCFKMAQNWAPDAVTSAINALEDGQHVDNYITTCASEVVKELGGSEEEMVMVAGFAGGMGMSGNACGALAAGIWLKSVKWAEENEKSPYSNPEAERTFQDFIDFTDGEILCKELCGKSFMSVEEHSKFITEGGCEEILNILAEIKQVEEYA